MIRGALKVLAVACVLSAVTLAVAQDQPNNGGGNQQQPRDHGSRGHFDPAQMHQQYVNSYKDSLGLSDDEWKVLQPKLDKVMTMARDLRGDRGGFSSHSRGGPDQNANSSSQPQSAIAKASADLQEALKNKDTPADQIAAKLTAFREAKEKAKQELAAAQKELKELLTARQEAILVTRGYLD